MHASIDKNVCLFYLFLKTFTNGAVIQTTSGPVKGQYIFDEGVEYFSYQGIPYAEPPIGSLRFKPPLPKRPWSETFNATKFGPVCPQGIHPSLMFEEGMSEDCLSLNIYVPAEKTKSLLPVLVFVHSGMFLYFSGGDDLCGPQTFMQQGVILVTFNYRIGALGFLSVQTEEAAGNTGLKDTILAIKWIKDNINRFGGDGNKITIGGNSSGAAMVHYLVLCKRCKGLFQKAFMMGGNALSYRYLNKYPLNSTQALGAKLGFATDDLDELMINLRQVDALEIVKVQENENDTRNGIRYFAPFVPVIEYESDHAVITKHPLEIIKSETSTVPLLAGRNSQEGSFMLPFIYSYNIRRHLNENFELCIPSNIEYPYGSEESKNLAKAIQEFYFNNDITDGDIITQSTLQNYVDMVSDLQHNFSTDHWIKLLKSVNTSNPVYYYIFDFDGDLNIMKLSSMINFTGMAHGDEQGYMFITNYTKPLLKTASMESRHMINILMKLITNFVKYGNPTPAIEETSDIIRERGTGCLTEQNYLPLNNVCPRLEDGISSVNRHNFWMPHPSTQQEPELKVNWTDCGTQRNYLLLNTRPTMVRGPPDEERLNFWYKVYEDYERYVQSGGRLEPKLVP